MSAEDKDLPAVPATIDGQLRRVLEPMREAVQRLMGKRGADGRAAVLWDDLQADGLAIPARRRILIKQAIEDAASTGGASPGGSTYVPDLSKPPVPSGFSGVAGFSNILLEWNPPVYATGHGHKQANIYATKQAVDDATVLTFADAVRVDQAPNALTVRALPTDLGIRWRVWVRFESVDGVESDPAGGPGGLVIDVPRAGSVSNAMLGTAVVDDAKIANLSAAKLTAGDGTVGGTLKSTNYVGGSSGWILRPDGYLEASGAVIRGTVYASAGSIGGNLLGSDYIQSATFGAGTGWQLKSNGTGQIGGITVGGTNVRAGQTAYDTGTGFYLGADGRFSLGKSDGAKLTFDPGTNTLTVSGNVTAKHLDAATGTFSGQMTADAVNAVNTINLAENAVTIPVSKQWSGSLGVGFSWQAVTSTDAADFAGQPVSVGVVFDVVSEFGGAHVWARIKRSDGAEVAAGHYFGSPSGPVFTCVLAGLDRPPTGAFSYILEVSYIYASGWRNITKAVITATGMKR